MGKQWKQCQTLFFWAPKSLQMVTAAMKFKRHSLLGRKAVTNLDRILKSRDITLPTKVHLVNTMVFQVVIWMWELDSKESWVPKNWCFWTMVLKRTLKSPLDSKEIKLVNPKGINPEYSLEGLILKLKFQYFGHLMWRANSLENWRQKEKGVAEDKMVI